jgi:hypothetical protein
VEEGGGRTFWRHLVEGGFESSGEEEGGGLRGRV